MDDERIEGDVTRAVEHSKKLSQLAYLGQRLGWAARNVKLTVEELARHRAEQAKLLAEFEELRRELAEEEGQYHVEQEEIPEEDEELAEEELEAFEALRREEDEDDRAIRLAKERKAAKAEAEAQTTLMDPDVAEMVVRSTASQLGDFGHTRPNYKPPRNPGTWSTQTRVNAASRLQAALNYGVVQKGELSFVRGMIDQFTKASGECLSVAQENWLTAIIRRLDG